MRSGRNLRMSWMRLVESSSSPVGGGVERLRLIACVMTSATGSTQ